MIVSNTSTPEKTIVWPHGMPDAVTVTASFAQLLEVYEGSPEGLRKAYALGSYGRQCMPNPAEVMPTFAESIGNNLGKCYNRVAFTAVATQALGFQAFPSVRRRNIQPGSTGQRHAYTMCRIDDAFIVSDPTIGNATLLANSEEKGWAYGWRSLVKQYPDIASHEGVIQMRTSSLPGVELEFLEGEATLRPVAFDVTTVDTVFAGISGLQSFLNLVENRSAASQGRAVNLNADFLTPQI
jgi:hypothetical protein